MRSQSMNSRSTDPRTICVGDELYRVVEYDLPDDVLHTWRVESFTVRAVHRNGVILDRLVGSARKVPLHGIGAVLHLSRASAVEAFVSAQGRAAASARGKIAEAERAIAWATSLTIAD